MLPAEVRGLLDARLAGLGDVPRQVLGAAAVIGRSFDLDSVRHASGRSDEETVAALEALVGQGLVRGPGPDPSTTSPTSSSARVSMRRPVGRGAAPAPRTRCGRAVGAAT